MRNFRISNTALGLMDGKLTAQIIIESPKTQEAYSIGPFSINEEQIASILSRTGSATWEALIGMPVQAEVADNKVIKIANYLDEDACIEVAEAADVKVPVEEEAIEESVTE